MSRESITTPKAIGSQNADSIPTIITVLDENDQLVQIKGQLTRTNRKSLDYHSQMNSEWIVELEGGLYPGIPSGGCFVLSDERVKETADNGVECGRWSGYWKQVLESARRENLVITTNAAGEKGQLRDADILIKHDMGCRHRAMVELAITHRLIGDLLKAGYELKVCDGEETTTGTEQQLVNAVFAVDVVTLFAKKDGETSGIYLVLGNDGWDVISDYSMSLEPIMKPINEWIDAQLEAGKF